MGEMMGASGDFYQRPAYPICVSESKEVLQEWWEAQPGTPVDDRDFSAYEDKEDPLDYRSVVTAQVGANGRVTVRCVKHYIIEIPVLE